MLYLFINFFFLILFSIIFLIFISAIAGALIVPFSQCCGTRDIG